VIAIRHRAVLEVIASTSYGAAEIVDGHSAGSVA
jgi:hypothetical protein